MTSTVRDFLKVSPTARAVAALDLGAGRAITVWKNSNDHVVYDTPRGHAFSLYLKGGTGTRRVDAGPETGRPGTICIMPEGERSEWEITTPFEFVHLYVPDDQLRGAFAETHNRDARLLDLTPTTFAEMPLMTGPLQALARAAYDEDALLADAALAELVGHLGSCSPALRGGLPPYILQRLDDWIDANLGEPIRLADLAVIADLSQFHLHRMFRISKGMAPHNWIMRRKIEQAKIMLRTECSVIEVAVAFGFSSQSHFTRAFRAHTAMTPTTYRMAIARG
ncbi:transcriptional regulator, AraC family [Jannaschia faecimaris]|uniref:Transcriptional regulator, AraC family n=1 Tax=Jannaschia faecimaris TaxID=1244108 RepID=A0A1H3Q8E8_9RHOB|nr:AraC family transcriptional regulator [Jannaschia faecimaris]SDZ09657.1 transcriptional regulator, AraC family [Jannaschia faecimaris]